MVEKTIFYFVNADGSGHTRRAESILQHLKIPAIVASEAPNLFKDLPSRHQVASIPKLRADNNTLLADDVLHIPYGNGGSYLDRVCKLCELCRQHQSVLAIVDVCVETAMVMRLCGIPYLYMRMSGKRNDAAHLQCYQAANELIASYPAAFEESWVPAWMRSKTQYFGGIFRQVPNLEKDNITFQEKPYILVIKGKGKSQLNALNVQKAACLIPNYYWVGIGFSNSETGENYQLLPYISNPTVYLRYADVVIANTGNNSVLEVGQYQKPLVTLPESRFFDEQTAKAERLVSQNLAIVLNSWPTTALEWEKVLERAQLLNTSLWPNILDKDGAEKAARYIEYKFRTLSE